MKNLIAAFMFIVAFGFVAMHAAEAGTTKSSKVSGLVTAVDAGAQTVTVKAKDKDVTLMVNDKTHIAQGKEKKSLGDIQAGTKVTAQYVMEGDKMMARNIKISGKSKSK